MLPLLIEGNLKDLNERDKIKVILKGKNSTRSYFIVKV